MEVVGKRRNSAGFDAEAPNLYLAQLREVEACEDAEAQQVPSWSGVVEERLLSSCSFGSGWRGRGGRRREGLAQAKVPERLPRLAGELPTQSALDDDDGRRRSAGLSATPSAQPDVLSLEPARTGQESSCRGDAGSRGWSRRHWAERGLSGGGVAAWGTRAAPAKIQHSWGWSEGRTPACGGGRRVDSAGLLGRSSTC